MALWGHLAAPSKPQEGWPLEAVKAKTLILEDLWLKTQRCSKGVEAVEENLSKDSIKLARESLMNLHFTQNADSFLIWCKESNI